MSCETCQRLIVYVGRPITQKLLIELGVVEAKVRERKQCSQCANWTYAKGLCLNHYMKARYKGTAPSQQRNELVQRLTRKGMVLCDHEKCDYLGNQKIQWKDTGLWYCSNHWQEQFDKAKEAEITNLDNKIGQE